MPARRSRRVTGAALIGAVAILAAGAAAPRGAADPPIVFAPTSKGLFVAAGDAGGSIALNFLPATAPLPRKLVVQVPEGYQLDLNAAAGTQVASGSVSISAPARSFFATRGGNFVAEDPSSFASDPAAQSCAPGTHAAVWTLSVALAGQPVTVRVFVDPAGPPGVAYTLQSCPVGLPPETALATAAITIAGFDQRSPTADGDYVWRALVYPESDPSYELQALVPLPERVTLAGRYDRKLGQAIVTGQVIEGGKPAPDVDLTLINIQTAAVREKRVNADGRFAFRFRLAHSSDVQLRVAPSSGACAAPPAGAGRCVTSLTVPPDDTFATVWVDVRGGAVRSIRARDQRQADRQDLRAADFPAGFAPIQVGGADPCLNGRGERHVTITGESTSPAFVGTGVRNAFSIFQATGLARVYATAKEARVAFRREARAATIGCELGGSGDTGAKIRPFRLSGLPRATRAFRTVVTPGTALKGVLDFVFIQRGRSVAFLRFGRLGEPIGLEATVAARIASRMR